MKTFPKDLNRHILSTGLVLWVASAAALAGSFTPGNLVVERMGDGTQALSTNGNVIFFDEFTTLGTGQSPVNTVQIPTNGSSALIDSGTEDVDGGISLSPSGQMLCFPGYHTNYGYNASAVYTSPSASVLRGVGTVNASGVYQLAVTTTNYNKETFRSTTTDGNGNFWSSGDAGGAGIDYLGTKSAAANLTPGDFRQAHLVGTNLWFAAQNSSGSGGYNTGLYEFIGEPTGTATPNMIFLTNSTTPTISPYGFTVNNATNPMVIYYADDAVGIVKLTNNGSGTWTQAYVVWANSVFGLTADWSTTPATIYATTCGKSAAVAANSLVKIVDNGAGSTAVTNATAAANTTYRGLAFAPIAVTAANSSGLNLSLTSTTVAGGSYSWTGPNGFVSSQQNPTITNVTPAAAGTYTVAVTVAGTYTVTATTTVTVHPSATITTPTSVCPSSTGNQASVPSAGTGAEYVWTISGGTITAGAGTAAITYSANASGSISLGCSVTNSLGSGISGSATVSISAIPTTVATNSGPYCAGGTIQVFATGSASDGYSWTGPNGFTSSLQNPTITDATPAASGVYSVIRDTGCGQSVATPTTVTVNPIPNSTITAASAVCGNSTGNSAEVANAGAGAGYYWTISGGTITFGAATNAILYIADASGTLTLSCTVTNSSGCYSNASSAMVTIVPLPSVTISVPTPVLTNTVNSAFVPAIVGDSYAWTISGGALLGSANGNSISFATGTNPTTITLNCTVTTQTGCSVMASTTVLVAQPFTKGNLAVLRIGNGTETLSANGNSVFIEEFTTNGTLVQTVALPDSGTNAILEVPTSTVEGSLTLSSDGTVLALPGYEIALNNSGSSLAATASSAVPRAACTLDANANFEIAATTTDQYSAGNLRCIATDGAGDFWAAGSLDGTWYLASQSESEVQINQAANTRQLNIFNGNLYIVTASSLSEWGPGVYGFSGLPTSLTIPAPLMLSTNATAPGANPTGFAISPNGLTAYVADQLAGITKWTNSSGNWSPAYSFDATTTSADGLLVDWSGANPVLYGTTSTVGSGTGTNALFRLVDTGTSSEPVTLAVAGSSTLFRGIAFTPQPRVNQFLAGNDFGEGPFTGEILEVTNATSANLYCWSSPNLATPVSNWNLEGELQGQELGDGTGRWLYQINVNPASSPTYYIFSETNVGPYAAHEPVTELTTINDESFAVSTTNYGFSAGGVFALPAPPSITSQPQSLQVLTGQNAHFNVAATGSGLAYQWFFKGNSLPNASGAAYSLAGVGATNAGPYFVLVTNAYGAVTSGIATLAISVPPALRLVSSGRSTLQLTASSVSNLNYIVQFSTNLAHPAWVPILTNNTGASDLVNFQTNGLSATPQYYRLVFP